MASSELFLYKDLIWHYIMEHEQILWRDKSSHPFKDKTLDHLESMDDFTTHFVEVLCQDSDKKSNYIADDEYNKLDALLQKAIRERRKETVVDKFCRALVYVVDLFWPETE